MACRIRRCRRRTRSGNRLRSARCVSAFDQLCLNSKPVPPTANTGTTSQSAIYHKPRAVRAEPVVVAVHFAPAADGALNRFPCNRRGLNVVDSRPQSTTHRACSRWWMRFSRSHWRPTQRTPSAPAIRRSVWHPHQCDSPILAAFCRLTTSSSSTRRRPRTSSQG